NLDADGDGQSNTNELRAGTDPLDPNSVFRFLSITKTNGRDIRLDWTAVGGRSYVIQSATGLNLGQTQVFQDVSTLQVPGTNAIVTNLVLPGAATNRAGFYRLRLGP